MNAFKEAYSFDPENIAGRLSRIVMLVDQEDWQEARLELRRLEMQIDWEEKWEMTKREWQSDRMANLYRDFVTGYLVFPVLQAALLVGDRETISRIHHSLGADIEKLIDINHPLFKRLAPVAWEATLPWMTADGDTSALVKKAEQ